MIAPTLTAIGSGSLVGCTLGLVGGGGSILATPLLLYAVGIAQPHIAIGTGALAVSVNAYANLIGHVRKGHVQWKCAIVFALVGSIGALIASTLGKAMDRQRLLFLFGLLMLVVGVLMLRPRKSCGCRAEARRSSDAPADGFGGNRGWSSIWLLRNRRRIPDRPRLILATGMRTIDAVGSSLLAVGTFGLATALNLATSGMIDWPIAAEFIGGGIIGGVLGMLLSTRLSAQKDTLNRIFAALIFVVATYVLYRSGRTYWSQ